MNIQDQWFEPGDKVMRVSHAKNLHCLSDVELTNEPRIGTVHCVATCSSFFGVNVVTLVGYDHIFMWKASDFRRVEEIKLCVEAVKKVKHTEKELQP